MDHDNFKNSFFLTFAEGARPGKSILLKPKSVRKLGEAPHVLSALGDSYGAQVGEPELCGGTIFVPLTPTNGPLDASPEDLLRDLLLTSDQLIRNANGAALPLRQAVSHQHCIEPLRAITQSRERAEFAVGLKVGGALEFFSALAPKHFSEKVLEEDELHRLRMPLEGVCRSTPEGNVVLLRNSTRLHLSFEDYPMTSLELLARIEEDETLFIGMAKALTRNTYQALPGGELQTQLSLC